MTDIVYVREFYQAGRIVFEEGTPGYEMFIIEDGEIVIWKIINNEKKILATLTKGKIFGEMAIIDSSMRMATAEAGHSGATCIKVNAKKLEEALAQSPPLIRTVLKTLVENLRRIQK
ncbi:MAG: cyclic nucleotide-binding domain-containing protein [Pseudomonadota bacterium]